MSSPASPQGALLFEVSPEGAIRPLEQTAWPEAQSVAARIARQSD